MDELEPLLLSRRTAEAIAAGLSAKKLRGRRVDHRFHGIVRETSNNTDPTLGRIGDAIAIANSQCVIGGWASLRAQGNTWFDGFDVFGSDQEIMIFCPDGTQIRRRPGIRPNQGQLYFDEILDLKSYRLTTLARSTYDQMRVAHGVREAVVALDMAVSTTTLLSGTTLDDVRRLTESHRKTRGIGQARAALALGSTRSASPAETRTRNIAVLDAGLDKLLVNCPVFDLDGNLLGVADLFDPSCGLVIEADGDGHREDVAHAVDNVREELFERAGAVVIRVTAIDRRDRAAVVRRMRGGYRYACRLDRRNWTLEKPEWWFSWPPARRWD